MAVAVMLAGLLPAAGQERPTAARSFDSTTVAAGAEVMVTIAVSGYGQAGGVTETLPAGFTYVNSSLDPIQVTQPAGNKVRFTLQGDMSFTYTVTASGTAGPHTFSGTLRDSDRMDHAVTGDTDVTVTVTAPQDATAARSFDSTTVAAGAEVMVTIAVSGYGQAGGVTETLPAGFTYVNSSLDPIQVTQPAGNKVRFTLQGDMSFTYTVTASGTAGPHTFSGTLRDSDRMDHTVTGDTDVTVTAPPGGTLLDRYDDNDNGEIDLEEIYTALDDYFDYTDRITLEQVYELVDLYFA